MPALSTAKVRALAGFCVNLLVFDRLNLPDGIVR